MAFFKQWGELTGALTESDYKALLLKGASARGLPLTLIAMNREKIAWLRKYSEL